MADVEANVIVSPQCQRMLGKLATLDAQPEMAAAKRAIGVMALQDEKAHYLEQMKPATTTWPKLGNVTVIMRPRGSLPMIYDEADIAEKRGNLELVYASSRLFQSLTPNAPGNVMEVRPGAVRVGTTVAYAQLQQEGGMTQFVFGPDEYRTFKRNVSATIRGRRRPARRADGKRHSWKGKVSPWNVFYFKLLAMLRKMKGKSYHVPARPFLIKPKDEWIQKYCRILSGAIGKITG
jgi:phage gpG-like protein